MNHLLSRPRYIALTLILAMSIYAFVSWIGDLRFLINLYHDTAIPINNIVSLVPSLFIASLYERSLEEMFLVGLIAFLSGLVFSLFLLYIRLRGTSPGHSGAASGILGSTASLLGLGCAACGSLVLSSLFGAGAAGSLAFLPYEGRELQYAGIALLILSIFLLHRALSRPLTC